jgi:ferric-dicitrate binding protein FerR (iron transport regulator)
VSDARFEELYDRYSDGTLRPAEREEFLEFLGDPAHRERFVKLSMFESSVSEESHLANEGLGEGTLGDADPFAPGLRKSGSWPSTRRMAAIRLPKRDPGSRVSIGVVAAAALVVMGLCAVLLSGRSEDSGARRRTASEPKGARTLPAAADEPRPVTAPAPRGEAPAPEPPKAVPVDPPSFERAVARPSPRPEAPEPILPVPVAPPRESAVTEVEAPKESAPIPVVAWIERCQAGVFVVSDGARIAAEAGHGLLAGQGIWVGPDSSAGVRLSDGTRLELGSDTQIVRIGETAGGRSVQVGQGFLLVEAAKQAPGRPLVLTTPHSESAVLGTEFTLYATAAYTRLDVREGRVKFTRLPGITSLVVTAGHFAIAGTGVEFASRPAYSLWKPSLSGLQLWLKADAGVKGAGNSVAFWKDQSPAGNDAVQNDLPSQPTLVPQAVLGRPAIRFDGVDDFFTLPAGFGDFRSGLSAFLVTRVGASPPSMRFLDFDQGPTCDNICFARKDTPDKLAFWVYANCLSKGKVEAPGGILIDQFQSLGVIYAPPGRVTLYRNGVPVGAGTTTVPRDIVRKPNFIGKSNSSGEPFFKGDLSEILLYNRPLSEEERGSVERYLVSKYFDATTPPVLSRTAEK